MTPEKVIGALGLPGDAVQPRRVPKKMLSENIASSSDRRLVTEGVEEITWVATLKPSNCGIAGFTDGERTYEELAVLSLSMRPQGKADRLMELVHRAIPYPVLLVCEQAPRLCLSLAHKRWSQAKAGNWVMDGDLTIAEMGDGTPPAVVEGFLEALPLARQAAESLWTVYEGWMETVVAYRAAMITGVFSRATTPRDAQARHEALDACARLEAEMKALRTAARGETQLRRLVDLNVKLKQLEAEYAALRKRL
ncbi:DUF4391 domain-containing protein [Archangium lipolyticum]|uniref:DUF4391 domain-containing protein n=1 Tax=Archangium lipolyticum TaxID=2970465 RepID=UPI00214B5E4F|nr:DUF4391 domain-containing protein [Archangium lipolyticum]